MSEIKLPPLPDQQMIEGIMGAVTPTTIPDEVYSAMRTMMRIYAKDSIELDRQGRGEPVAFAYELGARLIDGEYSIWSPRLTFGMPNVPDGSIRNLMWLYANPTIKDSLIVADPVKGDPNTGCPIPPLGWHCTRVSGHDGPCAAVEAPEEIEIVKRGMDRLRSGQPAEPVKEVSDKEWLKQHEALMHRATKAAIVVGYGGEHGEHNLENAEKALITHARKRVQPASGEDAARTLGTAIVKAAQRIGIANDDHSSYSVPQMLHLLECIEKAGGEGAASPCMTLMPRLSGRVYLAGPMTGLPGFNFDAFNASAATLRKQGVHVENPAEHGIVDGAEWADYLRYDIGRLVTCGVIAVLPGWSKSLGASLEVHIAEKLGMPIIYTDGAERMEKANVS